jgi:alpha-amylase/alpha-mannosidase (GH57 family)
VERYICIHGHFYQPPRENPWLEAIEIQDSAHPYHDWNERVTAECYAPNAASRILDGEGRILQIVSNYEGISFDFGPTLLSWLEEAAPETYWAVIEADKVSAGRRSGHGNALAQVYNHLIMPLADRKDKRTQIIWGIRDFVHRFGRAPEGMWLAETAVDLETLSLLAEQGIQFTILAPRQAARTRRIGTGKWRDVTGGRIDPSRPYLCRLASGRKIVLFFYDGPISRAVAFEMLLEQGENFAERLSTGFSETRDWPQLLHIATDGETYGHHHKFGDMALAFALNHIESTGLARLTNYGEYLALHPPTHEVEVLENSSWSCVHGVERWRSDCGCNSGSRLGWHQGWRGPLRESLDWLRDQLSTLFEQRAGELLRDPWSARDHYIGVMLDRSDESVSRFIETHAARGLSSEDRTTVLKLMEIQRHALLMYTSCGWFFDELSGLETVQILRYAGRALQLGDTVLGAKLEGLFLQSLSRARSNIPAYGDGAGLYNRLVRPAMVDLIKVGAHFAISSHFHEYGETSRIFRYRIRREDYEEHRAGRVRLSLGRIQVASEITAEAELVSFGVLHLGDHDINGGVRAFLGAEAYGTMKEEICGAFHMGAFAEIVRLMDKHFGTHNYSLKDLFRDAQRQILASLLVATSEGLYNAYRKIFEDCKGFMRFLQELGTPILRGFATAAELTLNHDLTKTIAEDGSADDVRKIYDEMMRWGVAVDTVDIEFTIRRRLEAEMKRLVVHPADLAAMSSVEKLLCIVNSLDIKMNLWQVQNLYYRLARRTLARGTPVTEAGNVLPSEWLARLNTLGENLSFNVRASIEQAAKEVAEQS